MAPPPQAQKSSPFAKSVLDKANEFLHRPGNLVAWAILVGILLDWLADFIDGVATKGSVGGFSTGFGTRARIESIFGVGSFDIAVALVVALGLALLVPQRMPGGSGPGTRPGSEDADPVLMLVLTLGGIVVAVAALVRFVVDLTGIGQATAFLSGAFEDLAAIPLALAVALWASRLVPQLSHRVGGGAGAPLPPGSPAQPAGPFQAGGPFQPGGPPQPGGPTPPPPGQPPTPQQPPGFGGGQPDYGAPQPGPPPGPPQGPPPGGPQPPTPGFGPGPGGNPYRNF